ncbi:MAG TPA: cupin domain-containing protein [Acidobacteriaceae bacterium]|nr:cupin domain-containing protein [Acidobacteriaceae bacterium]
MRRRAFLHAAPAAAITSLFAIPAFANQASASVSSPELHPVAAGEDRFGSLHSLGFSELAFKVGTQETGGNLFMIEHRNLKPGGPPLHLHFNQEEWFYVLEGRVTFLVGEKRVTLSAGESILAPRRVQHTFSSVVPSSHLLIAFAPAGMMEQYFRDARGNGAMAAQPEFINRYDMKWIAPSPFKT